MVDTGATTSTILDGDCARLGLNCEELEISDVPTETVGAKIYPYKLPDVAFIFIDTKNELRPEILESIDVIEPTDESPRPYFSILGMDIIKRYKRFVYDYPKGEIVFKR